MVTNIAGGRQGVDNPGCSMCRFRRRGATVRHDGQPAEVCHEIMVCFNQAVRIVAGAVKSLRILCEKSSNEETPNPGVEMILQQSANPGCAFRHENDDADNRTALARLRNDHAVTGRAAKL